jgi:hypothetical protein
MLANRIDPARVAAVLEDLPWMYDRAAKLFGRRVPILWKTQYNEQVEREHWVTSATDALNAIRRRLREWSTHEISTDSRS